MRWPTNILKVGGYVDPLKPEGQIELSRNLQIATAAIDSTGMCLFIAFAVLDQPETFQALLDLLNSFYGLNLTGDDVVALGKNGPEDGAGFQCQGRASPKSRTGCREFFKKELLPPHNVTFQVKDEDLDTGLQLVVVVTRLFRGRHRTGPPPFLGQQCQQRVEKPVIGPSAKARGLRQAQHTPEYVSIAGGCATPDHGLSAVFQQPAKPVDRRAHPMTATDTPDIAAARIRLTTDPGRFAPLLGGGFLLSGTADDSMEAFLQNEAGIAADYLKERVQTLFLDGRAVDDPAAAVVTDGSVISLSAAMPGLAGAVLRRSGRYAAMRRPISHEGGGTAVDRRARITVTLKLFNLIARELGPGFLAGGIRIDGGGLRDFLERQGRWLWTEGDTAALDDREVAPADVSRLLPGHGRVWLQVTPR